MANLFLSVKNILIIDFYQKTCRTAKQIKSVAKYWKEALTGVTPPDVTIYGKTGTGKTAVAKVARKQLEDVSKDKDINIRVEYIRCDYTTEYQVITRLCQQLGQDVPYRGLDPGRSYTCL